MVLDAGHVWPRFLCLTLVLDILRELLLVRLDELI